MKALIVDDDRGYAAEISGRLKCDSGIVEGRFTNSTTYEVASLISQWVGEDQESLVFINLSLRCSCKRRQENAGAEVLKHLRYTRSFFGRPNDAREVHCVLYSCMTAEQLLRHAPDTAVVFSEGTTFVRLPFDPAKLDLKRLSSMRVREPLDRYIRGEFTLPDERHDWANWWGIKQLYDVHRAVAADHDLQYPAVVNAAMRELRTQQALYLYGLNPGDVDVTGNLFKRIQRLRREVGDRAPRILHVDDMAEGGWSDILTKVLYSARSAALEITRDGKSPYTDFRAGGRVVFRTLKIPKPQGGSETTYKEKVDQLYELVKAALTTSDFEADLVLLDLRLFAEPGARFDVKKLSGAQILVRLREDYGGIPVIMTTASNKAWTFEQLTQLGADGYWMKEGLDDRKSSELSVRNYHRLLKLVAGASGEYYSLLRSIKRHVDQLRNTGRHWWESASWPYVRDIERQTEADRAVVLNILDTTVQMMRTFLNQYVMGVGHQSPVTQNLWACTIIRHAANVLEEVHGFDDLPLDFRTRGTIGGYEDRRTNSFNTRRGDWFAYGLYGIRNDASHHERAKSINWVTLKTFLADLMCYLSYRPAFGARKPLEALRAEDDNYRSLFDSLTKGS